MSINGSVCNHPNMTGKQCQDCGTIIIDIKPRTADYRQGFDDGFNAAMRLRAEGGGRVPEDAIEHRNGPTFKDSIETKGEAD
jgi:hypothetical protein